MVRSAILKNKWFRRVGGVLAGIGLLWVLAWLVVPPILKSQVEKIAGEQLGRQVRIGSVDFRPWSLELTVKDFSIATADGSDAQLHVERLYIDGELQSLLRWAPVVDALTVQGPRLKLKHLGDGRYDIDDILARLQQKPAAQPPSEPPRFALYNLELTGGTVDFTEVALSKTHEVREMHLSLPFLSNLESHREIKVEPRLAFLFNGSRFDSAGEGTPFAQTGRTDASIRLGNVDLSAYMGYIPASVPVKLQAAMLDADLKVAFAQAPKMSVKISGTLDVRDMKLADAQSQELLAFDALKISLADVRPLERAVKLSAVQLERPRFAVRRDQAGRLNLDFSAGTAPAPDAPEKIAEAARPASAAGQNSPQPAAKAWNIELEKLALRDGLVAWTDETTSPGVQLELREVAIDAATMAFPFANPMQFEGSALIGQAAAPVASAKAGKAPSRAAGARAAETATARLQFKGQATDQAASVHASLAQLPLALAAPYLAQQLVPTLTGELSAEADFDWKAPAERGKPAQQQLSVSQLTLRKLALQTGKEMHASVERLQLADARIDLTHQTAALGKLAFTQPRARVERGTDKHWMFETWRKTAAAQAPVPAAAQPPSPVPVATAPVPWQLSIAELAVDGGGVSYLDKAPAKPVAFELSAFKLGMANIAPESSKPAPLTVSARLVAGPAEPAQLSFRGQVALATLAAQGELEALRIPVHAFEPYFADALNVELLRADASFKGQVSYAAGSAGPTVKVSGDTALEDLRANSLLPPGSGSLVGTEQLLNWKALSLRGFSLALAPGTATTVDVRETVLSDFFARVVIRENGRINLQDIVKTAGEAPQPQAAAGTASAAPAAAASAAPVAAAAPGPNDPVIRFGPISLLNGRVAFSDRFVKPNYSANLSELSGKLGAFSSVATPGAPPQLAELELRGRAEGTASLEIVGQLNPLAKPLALDIKGKVRDLELPPLSTYSIKYAGHGIERGKLSVDVAYRVLPDGQLTASNKLVLNQLSFGEKVEGAPASLPVKLAVALLADRNGVIDIDLPISGSLNDPQFSLGPVIFKVIVNLIVKAVTSPFSLLAGAFGGGGDELSQIAFAPGSAALGAEARQRLDKVAQALAERPALKMTVAGTANLEAEREAYRRERLNQLLRAEKRRAAVVGSVPAGTASAVVSVSEAEYPLLLKEVYKRADIAKPRNVVGLAKDLPTAEMEALLLANIVVTSDAMGELALRRGVAVRDYLASRQLPTERLFLGAAKTAAPEAGFSPHAELSLSGP